MIDLENLTIVEALTLNAMKWRFNRRNPDRWFYEWHHLTGIGPITQAMENTPRIHVIKALDCRDRLNSNKTSWIHATAFKNVCKKLAWPDVKLPGYTREQVLKEARNTIQFVKYRYLEAR